MCRGDTLACPGLGFEPQAVLFTMTQKVKNMGLTQFQSQGGQLAFELSECWRKDATEAHWHRGCPNLVLEENHLTSQVESGPDIDRCRTDDENIQELRHTVLSYTLLRL